MATPVNGAAPIVPRDDWFDRLARRSAGSMSRRDAVRVFSGATVMMLFGIRMKTRPPFGVSQSTPGDPGCDGIRTFYRGDCAKPVPKLNYKPAVNGCGPQNGVNPVPQNPMYLANFTPACDEHDRGYGTCNRPKELTDQQFLKDMTATCVAEYPVTGLFTLAALIQCGRNAEIYYTAVSNLGDGPYAAGQSEGCDCCDECPGGGPKCGGECCRRGFICGEKGLCCEDCKPGWIKCPYPKEPRCGFGCCMPGAPLCCPGMHAGDLRCCNNKCYMGGCA